MRILLEMGRGQGLTLRRRARDEERASRPGPGAFWRCAQEAPGGAVRFLGGTGRPPEGGFVAVDCTGAL